MWRQINTTNGRVAFCDWFVRLFAVGMIVRLKKEIKDDSSDDEHEDEDEEEHEKSPTGITTESYTNKLSKRMDNNLLLSVDTVATLYEVRTIMFFILIMDRFSPLKNYME
jgi:hypothetical protein